MLISLKYPIHNLFTCTLFFKLFEGNSKDYFLFKILELICMKINYNEKGKGIANLEGIAQRI